MSKIASKKLGAGKFTYLTTEKFKKMDGKKGIGALFVSEGGVQLRYNYISSLKGSYSINSVDYWKGRKIGDTPNLSIYFTEDMNIVQINNSIWKTFKMGKLTEGVEEELETTLDTLDESKASEKQAARDKFAADNGIKGSYANSSSALRKKAGEMGLEVAFEAAMNLGKDVQEVTSTSKVWKTDEKLLQGGEIFADPAFVFTDMEEAAKVVAQGRWRSLIIAGMGGIGKTFGVKEVLKDELGDYGEGPDGKWAFYEGLKTTGFGLFKLLLLNKDKLIVFDDSDSIWGDKDMTNMMKIVTSDSGDRSISWTSNSTANVALMSKSEREVYEEDYISELMEDPNTKIKPPSTFNFTGQMINISNMAAEKFDDAIKSRAIFINVYLSQRDVIRRMYTIKQFQGKSEAHIKMLLQLIDPDATDALEGIGKYGGEVRYITPEDARKNKTMNMRTLDIAEALMEAGVKNLQHMVSLYA